jgi:aryl-alcohol dehydrogenase-like predicted oxidoreductase
LVPNPLHVFEQNLLSAAIIELGCPAIGVASDSLSSFKGAVIFQKIRDACRPERVRRIVSRQPGSIPWFPIAAGKLAQPGGKLDAIAKRHGATVAQLSIAWLLHR